jgi:hypothetical protein
MIVRELITLLGFSLDKASYDKAAKAYDQLQGKMTQNAAANTQQLQQQANQTKNALGAALGMAQRFAAQFQITNMLRGFVTMASSANETANALEQLFGREATGQIDQWSRTMGAKMGRSQYDLQAYAARLGSVLGPVTKSREEAQKMAESLSELSVDLASFFDTSDEQAMMALRSGLTGEYESLKRYGVVLNDSTLAEIAHARGINKKVTQMTVAEKTELRYAAIIERTKAAQGDAARTIEGFANASKALAGGLKDVGINMAKKVLPMLERLVRWARDAVVVFNQMAANSHILESAFIALAGVASILALEFYGAFILPAAAVAALILVIDELWTTLEGGDSLLRDLMDATLGPEKTAELLERIKTNMEALQKLDGKGMFEQWGLGVQMLVQELGKLVERFNQLIPGYEWLKKKLEAAKTGKDAAGRAAGQGLGASVLTEEEHDAAIEYEQRAAMQADSEGRKQERQKREHAATQYKVTPGGGALEFPMPMGGQGYGVLDAPVAAGAGQPTTTTVTIGGPVFNINGGNPAEVTQTVTKAMDARDKKLAAAVGGRGRS